MASPHGIGLLRGLYQPQIRSDEPLPVGRKGLGVRENFAHASCKGDVGHKTTAQGAQLAKGNLERRKIAKMSVPHIRRHRRSDLKEDD